MLFKASELAAIEAGRIVVAFRRWRRPTVKTGGSLKTPVGILDITGVATIDARSITAEEARRAGYEGREALMSALDARKEGTLYRIDFRLAGPDPRLSLREEVELSEAEVAAILRKLERMDALSRHGGWTRQILRAIRDNPRMAAVDLAGRTGFEKDWLKTHIRKLKNLGLTISHQPGYELSPRGLVITKQLGSAR